MFKTEGILVAKLSQEPDKAERHILLWQDIFDTINYIIRNPKYKEIGITFEKVVSDPSNQGGVTSDSQSRPT